jgi:hypothetical protein
MAAKSLKIPNGKNPLIHLIKSDNMSYKKPKYDSNFTFIVKGKKKVFGMTTADMDCVCLLFNGLTFREIEKEKQKYLRFSDEVEAFLEYGLAHCPNMRIESRD